MSVSKQNKTTGEMTDLTGSRVWIGTKEAHDALVSANKMPNNCLVALTNAYRDADNVTPTVMNVSNSDINVNEPFYVNKTNSMEVALVVMRAMKTDIDNTGILTSYVGHITAYTTDSSGYPDVRVGTYIASACWGANGKSYIRMRIMSDNGSEYEANLDQTGTTYNLQDINAVNTVADPITRSTTRTSSMSEIGALKCHRVAQIKCYVEFKDIITNTWNTVGTVVDSLKPAMETIFTISEGTVVAKCALFRLNTDGNIQVWGNAISDGDSTRISATYFTAE